MKIGRKAISVTDARSTVVDNAEDEAASGGGRQRRGRRRATGK